MFFKYVLNEATREGNVGPNDTQNRTYTFPNTDPQTLPPVYFNNVSNLGGILTEPVANGQLTLSWTGGPQIRL